ncbi:unnamed protein product, partial [Meganyctiphanes norvegica]
MLHDMDSRIKPKMALHQESEGEDHKISDITVKHLLQPLPQRFYEFQQNLEVEVSELLEKQCKEWETQNLSDGLISHKPSLMRTHSIKRGLDGKLPQREFIARPSLLNELLQVNHMESIYNIFVAILILLFFNKLLEEIIETGRLTLDLSLIIYAFGSLDRVIIIWITMFTFTSVMVFVIFHFWAHNRHLKPAMYDRIAAASYILYLIMFMYLPVKSLLLNNLPPASSFIVLCEQVRLFMKTWAFVRSNIPLVINYKKSDDTKIKRLTPDFSHFLYFLFAPTLVYRDDYPRNANCNWRNVMTDLSQVVGCLFYTHFLFVRFCIPVFRQFGCDTSFTGTKLLVGVFSCMFPGSLVLICAFFSVLHSWLNAFAEMLTFADRMFYKDWWNSTSYSRFYRTWNCVVHDWLYEYVYKDIAEWQSITSTKTFINKLLPTFFVFRMNICRYVYILHFIFKYPYPNFSVMAFMFIKRRAQRFNIFLWVTLILGTGILMCLYSMEWYARINCPPIYEGFQDYLVPRSWFCTKSCST